ncbi:hypothetical protein MVEN_00497900 [Mycena venus]|uniref:Uncharacterized protein n=1 Tax=Mycena venus TaxID=2733690 RepID=A0A8H7DB23_9AGAR|nr:hypothetical protein MVEN_00497900 [Mycena venus]
MDSTINHMCFYIVFQPHIQDSLDETLLESYSLFRLVFPTETPFLTTLLKRYWKQIALNPQLNSTSRL